jgi:hypothetical protein
MALETPILTNFTSGELSPRLDGRVDLARYYNGCRELTNFIVHPHGGASRRGGFRLAAAAGNPDKPSLLLAFEFNAEQAYVLEFFEDQSGAGKMRVFKDGGLVLAGDGAAYVLDSPYVQADFERLRHVQSNDTLFLVHPAHPPRSLTRTGHAEWSFAAIEFTGRPEAWDEGGQPGAVCFFEQRLVLAGTPGRPNTLWFSRSGDFFDLRTATRETPLDGWRDVEIAAGGANPPDGRPGDQFTLYAGSASFQGGCALKGRDPAGTSVRYYRYKGTRVRLAATSDLTVAFVDGGPPGDSQIESVHDLSGNLRAEFWEEFEPGVRIDAPTGEGPEEDDGIEVTLAAAQANAIEFLAPKARLWVGTAGAEWTLGGADGGAVTPLNIKASLEGVAGAARVRPEAVGQATLFVQRQGRKLRELTYRFESDGLASRDLTLLSEHLTQGGVTALAYAQEPDSVLFCLRADGALLALTYEPDQEVTAWSRLVTAGSFESLACVPGRGRDELWAVVRRTVNGEQRRFVEVLDPGLTPEREAAEAFFVDCGLTYQGPPVTRLTGLAHLAGETVQVLADGAVLPPRTVDGDGGIDLDRPCSLVHAGLGFGSALTTMRLEGGGGAQARKKRVTQVAVRFHRSLGGRLGAPGGPMETLHFRASGRSMDRPPELWSGDRVVKFPRGSDTDGLVRIEADQPLPMTVLLIAPTVAVHG